MTLCGRTTERSRTALAQWIFRLCSGPARNHPTKHQIPQLEPWHMCVLLASKIYAIGLLSVINSDAFGTPFQELLETQRTIGSTRVPSVTASNLPASHNEHHSTASVSETGSVETVQIAASMPDASPQRSSETYCHACVVNNSARADQPEYARLSAPAAPCECQSRLSGWPRCRRGCHTIRCISSNPTAEEAR